MPTSCQASHLHESNLIYKKLWDNEYNPRLTPLPKLVSEEAGFEFSSPSDSATHALCFTPRLSLRLFTWKQSRQAESA